MINFPDLSTVLIKALFESAPSAKNSNAKTTDLSTKFAKGEMIQGTVTKSLGPEGAIIRMRGMDMVASTPKPLAEGTQILVKVDQTTPQFVVSLLPNNTPTQEKTAALLRMYLPAEAPMASVINDLNTLLPLLTPAVLKGSGLEKALGDITTAAKKPDPQGKNPVQLMGLFHESELLKGKTGQNLKHALLVVRQNMEKQAEKSGGADMGQLKKVNDAISNIELRQLMAISQKGDMKGWQIPYWNGQNLDTGLLFIGQGEKENNRQKRDGAVRLTVMVKMTNLGDVRADAISYKDKLEGIIYAGTDNAVAALESDMASLTKGMEEAGITAHFGVQKASKDFLTKDLREESALPVENLLNLRV
jgi:hypothetical protein